MKVFKFGGASVKDAAGVRNLASILRQSAAEPMVLVVSAMGKTTNALEKVTDAYFNQADEALPFLNESRAYHQQIMEELFPDKTHRVFDEVNNCFVEIEWVLDEEKRDYDFVYDQIVSQGELISTYIVAAWLEKENFKIVRCDIRDSLHTDNHYREGKVNWEVSSRLCRENYLPLLEKGFTVITQGFIASTSENYNITLGREGSDYSAAILAHVLDAESLTIWKDVPGVLNADPRHFQDAQKIEQMSYLDAIELAYYGASVIHPKTIQPLENKNIPLFVKSFVDPGARGTQIGKGLETKPLIPTFIVKNDQVLISISSRDFSFITEESLSDIFQTFAENGIHINLMQNSAVSFSVCADYSEKKIQDLLSALQEKYFVRYNTRLQLFTVRHYYPSTIDSLTHGREVMLEQRSRHTAQVVMKAPQ